MLVWNVRLTQTACFKVITMFAVLLVFTDFCLLRAQCSVAWRVLLQILVLGE